MVAKIRNTLLGSEAENVEDIVFLDGIAAKGNQLIQHRFRIAHAAFRSPSQRVRSSSRKRNAFFGRYAQEVIGDQWSRNPF